MEKPNIKSSNMYHPFNVEAFIYLKSWLMKLLLGTRCTMIDKQAEEESNSQGLWMDDGVGWRDGEQNLSAIGCIALFWKQGRTKM
jgi:hypothetical protein